MRIAYAYCFLAAFITGCAAGRPTTPTATAPTGESSLKARYTLGYRDGYTKATATFSDEYGEKLRLSSKYIAENATLQTALSKCRKDIDALVSPDALNRCKVKIEQGVEFSRRCLLGAKKYKAHAEACVRSGKQCENLLKREKVDSMSARSSLGQCLQDNILKDIEIGALEGK